MHSRILVVAVLCAWLTACGQKPANEHWQPDAGAGDAATPSGPATAAAMPGAFSVNPPSMSVCGQPVVATLRWDVRTAHSDVAEVQIFAGTDEAPTLFAEGGNHGEATTGPWAGPGSIFRLRDKASGKELERAEITGPACQ